MATKKCTKCGAIKPVTDFYAKSGKCKPCFIAHHAQGRALYRQLNKKKEALTKVAYYQANRGEFTARLAKRRAIKRKATPLWAETKRIQAYYDVASFFNEVNGYVKYHVDHVIPLAGKKVSGLHVHQNLRVILAAENISKKNKFEI